ncbi:DUF4240 domain-containing protein [Streptomyces sp. NPDC001185]|uniref:DUF4240 domain-containing protein n=1 Tax=Streptomyces sp. NPDC001185 TaxID=3154380 RepID=UPI0033249945
MTGPHPRCPAEEILAFEHRFSCLRTAVYRWDVWAAAYLVGGGCSDDRFSDFTAGLVALGREWYERAAACPDALAEHPAVRAAPGSGDLDVIFDQDLNFAACSAYERLTGDWEDWAAYADARVTTDAEGRGGMGESFAFGDDQQIRRRLPRLAALASCSSGALVPHQPTFALLLSAPAPFCESAG